VAPPPQTSRVSTRWEVDEAEWERVSRQIRARLEETARNQAYITYGDLVAGNQEIAGPHSHALAAMLGEISADCHAEGLPLLSALVVYKDAMEPGSGFFKLAEGLGVDLGSNERARWEFWMRNLNGAHEHWAPGGRSG
jgi:hypothetical protein